MVIKYYYITVIHLIVVLGSDDLIEDLFLHSPTAEKSP
jgi:hypothetical protein